MIARPVPVTGGGCSGSPRSAVPARHHACLVGGLAVHRWGNRGRQPMSTWPFWRHTGRNLRPSTCSSLASHHGSPTLGPLRSTIASCCFKRRPHSLERLIQIAIVFGRDVVSTMTVAELTDQTRGCERTTLRDRVSLPIGLSRRSGGSVLRTRSHVREPQRAGAAPVGR